MRLGIMQPYFLPYIGYFQLMGAVDRWIVFDTPQYIRKGWVNRNRVLSLGNAEWKYIHVPVNKAPRSSRINEITIVESSDWRGDLIRNLDYYKIRRAPYYKEAVDFVDRVLSLDTVNLSELLTHSLREACDYLGILPPSFEVFSTMNLDLPQITEPGEWALRISEALKAESYINPPGGREIFSAEAFERAGVELRFIEPVLTKYDQKCPKFVSGLSIVDILMWNSPKDARQMLKSYKIAI